MEARVEEIISRYVDALNAGDAQPVDTFLAQFPELSTRTAAGLRKTLTMLEALRRAPVTSEEEQKRESWRRLESRMEVESSRRKETDELSAAAFSSPTIGEYLSHTLAEDPSSLKEFNIPEDILLRIAEDDSPLQTMQTNAGERFRLAQRYALHDQSLLSPIGALVTHLMRLWKSAMAGTTNRHAFTRPARSHREKS